MKQTSFIAVWVQRSSILLAAMLAFTSAAFGQANFLTVFGDAGCNKTNRMTCSATPSSASFTQAADPYDHWGITYGSTVVYNYQNSCYDKSGQLLFSVNGDGIYGPDGTYVFGFATDITGSPVVLYYTIPGCPLGGGYPIYYAYYPTGGASEIVMFPVPGKCNSYYVVFWCALSNYQNFGSIGGATTAVLRCVEVDLTANYGNSSTLTSSWYTFNDQLLDPPTCQNNWCINDWGFFEIVADKAAGPNSPRDIYTLNPEINSTSGNFSTIRKWTFPYTGALPVTSTKLSVDGSLPLAYVTKAKIFTVGGDKLFTYVSGQSLKGNLLITFDLTTTPIHSVCNYIAPEIVPPTVAPPYQNITGFEYLPGSSSSPINKFVIAYDDETNLPIITGGLGYVTPATSGSHNISPVSVSGISFTNYCHSDLELDKNGDMIMIYDDMSGNGSLAYLKANELSTSFTATLPHRLYSTCSGAPPISIFNFLFGMGKRNWYLGSQIRGENYNTWGDADLVNYVISTNTTWSPTNNPVYNASGSTTPVYTMTADNIIINAGVTLTINGMTIENEQNSFIDVNAGTTTTQGGRLVLNNTTLTRGNACGSGVNMWGGVRVWGDPAQSQLPLTTTGQGIITMNNSTISYAQTGVALGQPHPIILLLSPPFSYRSGGLIQATRSTFSDNSIGVAFYPYQNTDPHTGAEISNRSYFGLCNFQTNDPSTISGTLYDIWGNLVKSITVDGCNFSVNTTTTANTYGIYANNMGFTVNGYNSGPPLHPTIIPSTFSNFTNGIYHLCGPKGSYTASVLGSVFTNNTIGINLNATPAPVIAGNTFNVPYLMHFSISIQSIGLLLNTADLFSVYNNTFKAMTYISPTLNKTVGVLASNTEHNGDDNLINNNSYSGLGAANLANYKNNATPPGTSINHGLWYKCNKNKDNVFDISSVGSDRLNDGIRLTQGYPGGDPDYPSGLPAGNIFTSSSSLLYYNIYIENCARLDAYYFAPTGSPAFGLPTEQPGNPPITAQDGGYSTVGGSYSIISLSLSAPDQCTLPGDLHGHLAPLHIIIPPGGSQPDNVYLATINNINYYMNSASGIGQRDSLYYWVKKLNSAAGKLILAKLMVEDSLIDSANSVYDAIPATYWLDSVETIEHTQGRSFMNIIISNRIHHGWDVSSLDSTQADSLRNITANSSMWAHVKANHWLYEYDGTPITDSFLFPSPGSTGGGGGAGVHHVTISPNPVSTHPYILNVIADPGFLIHHIQLTNVTTPSITYTQTFSGTTNNVNMNVAGVMPGVYTLKATDIHGAIATIMFHKL